jgi:Ras-related protein Rab-6A
MNTFKLVLLGDSGVGKTSILKKYLFDRFDFGENITIGASFFQRTINYQYKEEGKEMKLQIWDTAGQERFRSLVPMYVKNSNVCLIVFDCTDIDNINDYYNKWYDFIEEHKTTDNTLIYLVGTKRDLVNVIDVSRKVEKFIEKIHIKRSNLCFVSSKTGDYINELFNRIIIDLHEKNIKNIPQIENNIVLEEPSNTRNYYCC